MAKRRLRLGMVGGGQGAFIGAVHRIAARMDDRFELVAGCFASTEAWSKTSGLELGVDPERIYGSFEAMATAEADREDGIDVVAVVTPNNVHYAACATFLEAGIPVICDKPMTTSLEDAAALQALVASTGNVFVLTHNYTGYPMIRQAKAMVEAGLLGEIRVVQVEYAQDWLATRLESEGLKQAEWRTDPARSGPAGCTGDIGTHAANLATFVTGLDIEELAAELSTFVEGRSLDDNCQVLLRYSNGARGMLWASQVACGNDNGLKLRVYGDKGGLEWVQESPNELWHAPLGEPKRLLTRSGAGIGPEAARVTRIPPGHPEGYLEGFANIYGDTAELLWARIEGREPDPATALLPTVTDGVKGVKFIEAALHSSRHGGRWTSAVI